jgi:hypothetical protein
MILLLDALVVLFLSVVAFLFVSQVVIPIKNKTPLFPDFGGSKTHKAMVKAQAELEDISETEKLKRVNDEINRRKANLKGE